MVDFVKVSRSWNTDLEEVLQSHFISLLNNYTHSLRQENYYNFLPSICGYYTDFLDVARLVKELPTL